MKLEQIYNNIRERLNVGDKLFAGEDGVVGFRKQWKQFINKLYAPDYEPNTEDEEKVLELLMNYFNYNKSGELGAYLKDLLPLKSKFPQILDPQAQGYIPASSEETEWVSNGGDYVWRGATMPLNQAQKLIQDAVYTHPAFLKERGFIINQPSTTYTSRGKDKGFTSFSSDLSGAIQFKGKMGSDSVSVIYGVKKSNPNLVMNPDASNSISRFMENETLYVGDNVKPDVVIINDVRIMAQMYKDARSWVKAVRDDSGSDPTLSQWGDYGTQWAEKSNLKAPSFDDVKPVDFQNITPTNKTSSLLDKQKAKYDKMKSLEEIYTEIQLSEVGEGTSEPFKYEKDFERGNSFGYTIDGFAGDERVPIKLQGLDYKERVSDDMEMDRPEFYEFIDKPKGTILNGFEIIFSRRTASLSGENSAFAEVNDRVFMYRLMATIKKILQDEFAKSKPDILIYTPNKKGSEAIEKTGRHKLYNAFIRKAFPDARVLVDDRSEEIIYKLK